MPLDEALHIDRLPFKISIDFMLEICFLAIKLDSYEETEQLIRKFYDVEISDDNIRKVVNFIGQLIFKEDCRIAQEYYSKFYDNQFEFDHSEEGVLYLETDGAALNTRIEDENGSTWRENKLAIAFNSNDIHIWKNSNGEKQHEILKREYISYIGGVEEFKKHMLALAIRNGYGEYKETVIISDGATWIRNMKNELFPDAIQILDFFHLCENTYQFSKYIHQNNEKESKRWAKKICDKLEKGKYKEVLKELEEYKGMKVPAGTVNLYQYIYNNRDNIDYPTYKKKGYFIGSGAIESANKTVMQSRMKLSGMRWNPDNAQGVVTLKTKEKSQKWQSYVEPFVTITLG